MRTFLWETEHTEHLLSPGRGKPLWANDFFSGLLTEVGVMSCSQERGWFKSVYVTKRPDPIPGMKSNSLEHPVLTPGSSTSRETSFYHWADQSPLWQQVFTVPLKLGRDDPKSHAVHLPQTCVVCLPSEILLFPLLYGMLQFWWHCCTTAYKPQYIVTTVFWSTKTFIL